MTKKPWLRHSWKRVLGLTDSLAIIFHGGGLVIGNAEVVPKIQIQYLVDRNFVVVIPNYRLSPQVSAVDGAIADAENVLGWCTSGGLAKQLPPGSVSLDTSKIVTMGHSAGGMLALYVAAKHPETVKAVSAFYPSLYLSDPSTSGHQPAADWKGAPDFAETPENMAAVKPELQVTEFPLPFPGVKPQPRHLWLMHQLKNGTWLKAIQPDGNFEACDPAALIKTKAATWPPTLILQGDRDKTPASTIELAERAVAELKAAGAKKVEVHTVPGEGHMFDILSTVGTTDLGPKWVATKKGLDHLVEHV